MGTQVEVVRVFTDAAGQFGNALGVARAGDFAEDTRQDLAKQLGYSETVFVQDPVDGIARVRIYTPAVELPFAGHPTVGTAWWLADRGQVVHTLDVPAGPVAVEFADGLVWVRARGSWAPKFTFAQLADPADVLALSPDDYTEGHHYAWAWIDEARGELRSRMFAPDMGVAEDEATGAAAVALTALLQRGVRITQGTGSQLFTEWDSDGWVRLGGRVVADAPVEV
ncbi:PhzF family phenazine biosynthesis protein [Nocardia arthritidis]|uniref:PhzF family phenazine biosynthesis protein n=1 Tax=Nocardia arthritidis TaxID=228602 RepID=A0A6G9YLA8_9NOCA|nr:PhzF family phenazine biosynthesis protein [Nocardia arthritidis]QIS13816.1 PhzF family phenazine biosynthesis protein [Nocardia arthritidis]